MSYEVIARKWRPQQFGDVVGQGHVTQTLENAIKTDRIAHAYLFVGPRGTGKTSIARIFAKALNCVKGPTVTPCGKCDACNEIAAGINLDVLEIDGASNNGVEQVRDLRDTVKFAPTSGQFKIYIIDEVHMLTTAAFNALLKTLEEPPPHVKFIFATTEPEKILATILSRCQRFDLRRIAVADIIERLKLIAKDEKIKIDDDALLAIARGSEGGLRDAESALDQLVSFRGAKINEEDVTSVFGLVARSTLESLAEKILTGDIKEVIEMVNELDDAGKDLQRLIVELMAHFRNLLVCMHTDKVGAGLDLLEAQYDALKKQGELTDTERLLRIADILSNAENRIRYTLSKRILLETTLIRCARAAVVVSLDEVLTKLNSLKKNMNLDDLVGSVTSEAPIEKPVVRESKAEADKVKVPEAAPEPVKPKKEIKSPKSAPPPSVDAEEDLEVLEEQWDVVVEKVGKVAILAKSFLKDARPVAVTDDTVTIAFDPEFKQEMENFKSIRNKKAVETAVTSVLKRPVAIELKVAKAGKEKVADKPKRKKKVESRIVDDPVVKKALNIFDGTISEVRE